MGEVIAIDRPDVEHVKASHVPVLLACSSGGHVLQLLALRDAWSGLDRVWVADDTRDVRSLLAGERVVFAHGPTSRNARAFALNLRLALRVVRRFRPQVVVTTGAATAVPVAWVARLYGARVVYVESLSRIAEPSLSLRLIAPSANRIYVQWPELADRVRGARYVGNVLDRS